MWVDLIDREMKVLKYMIHLQKENPKAETSRFYFTLLIISFIILITFGALYFITKDTYNVLFAIVICIIFWVVKMRGLKQAVYARQNKLIFQLPILINKWLMGMTLGDSLQKIIRQTTLNDENYFELNYEYTKVKMQLENGIPLAVVLDSFARRCNCSEIYRLVYYLQVQMINGNQDIFDLLNLQLSQMWITRKTIAKKLGEEASSKLVFPLVVTFMTLMIILAAPILIIM
jgi:tight adherence protein C